MEKLIPISIFNRLYKFRASQLVAILMIIGAILRFYNLQEPGLWLDEIFSMNGADPGTTLADVYEYSKGDQPPFFFIMLHGWLKLFSYNDFAGRSLTCIYGVLGIPAIYFLGKELKDERIGLFVAFITTVNWFHADFSREIRFYPLVFLLSTLSYLFFLRSIKNSRFTDFLFYSVFTSLLLNTHYFGLVVFVSQFIIFVLVVILFKKRSPTLIVGSIISGVVTGFSLFHWLPIILKDLKTPSFHVQALSLDFPVKFAWVYFKEPIACIIYAVLLFLSTKNLYLRLREKKATIGDLVLTGWIFIGFMIPLVYSWVKFPLLTFKYSVITLPAIFLFIACGFKFVKREKVRSYCILALTVGALINFLVIRPLSRPRKAEDWREVASYFTNPKTMAEPQLVFSQLAYFHSYYFRQFGCKQELLVDQRWRSADELSALIKDAGRIWLLTHPRYPDTGFLPDQQQFVDREFELKDQVAFREAKAFLYVRKNADRQTK